MRHTVHAPDGTLTAIRTSVYLAKLPPWELERLLGCLARLRKYGPRFSSWLIEETLWEIDRRGRAVEPMPLELPVDWASDEYAHASAVTAFLMRMCGPQAWLLQMNYAVAQLIAARPQGGG